MKVNVDYRAIPAGINMLQALWHGDPNNTDLNWNDALGLSIGAVSECVGRDQTLANQTPAFLSTLSSATLPVWGRDQKQHGGQLANQPWFYRYNLHLLLFSAVGVVNRSIAAAGASPTLSAAGSPRVEKVAYEYAQAALQDLRYDSTGYLAESTLVEKLSQYAVTVVRGFHNNGYSITDPVHLRNALKTFHFRAESNSIWGPRQSEQLSRFYSSHDFDKLDNDIKERYLLILLAAWAACQGECSLPLADHEVRDPHLGL